MSYSAAVDHLFALGQELAPLKFGETRRKFDLAHMRALMAALGDPQRSFRSILIAGTNGKGSTAATLASVLACSGHRTGLYTSPHLVEVLERIQVTTADCHAEYPSSHVPGSRGPERLQQIPQDVFAQLYFRVDATAQDLVARGVLPHLPSFFEILTALAFLFFAEQRIDTAVLEVGLGGRLDATNIVDPLLSVITDIALDHQEYLGTSLAQITREKAGILRPNGTLITLPQHPEANLTIGQVAADTPGLRAISAADLIPSPNQISVLSEASEDKQMLLGNHYQLTIDGEALRIHSPLSGSHQQRNLALAIQSALVLRNEFCYEITNHHIERGVEETRWPGRLEFVAADMLLDVAHNPAGAWTLRSFVSRLPESRPRTLLFSCLRDKDLREMSQILFSLFDSSNPERPCDHIVFTSINNPRAATVDDLLKAAKSMKIQAHASPHVPAALLQARQVTPAGGIIIATGSVYLVGQVRALVVEQR